MDPDATWAEMMQLSIGLRNEGGGDEDIQLAEGERLAELVLAMDEWLRSGGFLPGVFRPSN